MILDTRFGVRTALRFMLYDGRYFNIYIFDMSFVFYMHDRGSKIFVFNSTKVKVTIWDDLIPNLDPLFEENVNHPRFLILASVKAKKFRSECTTSSLFVKFCY